MGDPLPCDVEQLVATRCRQCHGADPAFGATRPMLSWDDLMFGPYDGHDTLAEACLERMQLPMDDEERMPLTPQPPATVDEIAVMSDWIDAGTPKRGEMETCE